MRLKKIGDSKWRKPGLIALFLLVTGPSVALAQLSSQPYCFFKYKVYNSERKVTGNVHAECGGFSWHTAPWGNWGVKSPYGRIMDTDHFKGWKVPDNDTKKQWNSCTDTAPWNEEGNCDWYNYPNGECTSQRSSSSRTYSYPTTRHSWTNDKRIFPTRCPFDSTGDGMEDAGGCKDFETLYFPLGTGSSEMRLYELDWDGDDYVTTITYDEIDVSMNCPDPWCCTYSSSGWISPSGGTSVATAKNKIVVTWGDLQNWEQCDDDF